VPCDCIATLQDLISEVIPSQKYRKYMGSVFNDYGAMGVSCSVHTHARAGMTTSEWTFTQ
jgi:hypothetical protein